MLEVITLYRGDEIILVEPGSAAHDNAVAHGYIHETVEAVQAGEDAAATPKRKAKKE